uniref:ATP-dependent DNA helicase n=1 Tax=Trichogramma kaykai TaxID=54128 RepID=A0ABD2WYI1_9HYME
MNENEWERVKTLLIPRYEELITKKKVKDAQELGYINYLISRDLCKEKQDFLFLYLLVHLLPPKRTGRKRKKGDEEQATDNQPKSKLSLEERRESFILHVKNVGEIETKILEIKKRLQFDKGTFQPLIVAVGSSVKRIESYHLAVNDKLLLRNHFLGIEDIFQLRLIQNPSIQDFTYQDFQPNVQKEQIYFESDSDSDIYDYYENENSQSSRYNDFDDLDSCEYNAWESDLETAVLEYTASLFNLKNILRKYVNNIIAESDKFIKAMSTILKNNIEKKLTDSKSENLVEFKKIFNVLSNSLTIVSTEQKRFTAFKKLKTFVPPQSHTIGERKEYRKVNDKFKLVHVKVDIQIIPLRHVFKLFFELPDVFEEINEYMKKLYSNDIIVSNLIQGEYWKNRLKCHGNKIVYPLILYFDDYENNNPIGTHRGISKTGAVYVCLPCLPIHYQSNLENIFVFALFNSLDRETFTNSVTFSKIIDEINYLNEFGIEIETSSGTYKIFFELVILIADNLGLHSILGLTESFKSNIFCQHCLTNQFEKNFVLLEKDCKMRTVDNYENCLSIDDFKVSGLKENCTFHKINNFHMSKNICVYVMHDLMEGVCRYDMALILNYFIFTIKAFSLEDLNLWIRAYDYRPKLTVNKPPEIMESSLKKGYIILSSSEMLCLVKNVCLIIGDAISKDNDVWELLINLKQLITMVSSTIINRSWCEVLDIIVYEYLSSLNKLFPDIQISYNNLSFLPDDGDIIDMILNANNTSNDEEIDDTNSDNDIESSGVFSFPNIDQQNHINIELNLNFPTTDTQPINEFTKEGYMVCAFLALFPTGRGDFLQNRLVTITCLNYFSAMNPTSAPLIANEHPSQIQFSTVSPQNYKDDLSSLITTLQRHTKCGKHCLRKSNGILKCRYKFPHELQQHSSNDDTNGYYKFLPVRNDPYVQRYNHVIAQIWRANTDFSPIVDTTTVIKYIAKYASKGEVSSRTYMKIIEDLCKNNNKNCTAHKGISKIWISTVSDRDYSAQEVVHILMGWPLYQSSRNVVVLPLYARIKRILIQGKAGSGKSTLIRRIFDEVTDKLGMDSIAVTAPTGAAAINIYDGKLSMTEYNTLLQREDVNLKQDKKQHFNKSIHLLPTNDLVQDKNETCLRNLNIPVVAINAENKPDVYVNNENISGIPNILYLSLGCRVMLCDNTWVDGCLVNGSLGTVMVILYEENVVPPSLPKYIMVEFDTYAGPFIKNRTFPITPIIRTREKYGMKLTTKQFPLKLAYAITIHKSQCLTLTSAIIDVGSKEFSSRLTYVALSRSKKLTYIMFSRFYDKSRFDSIAKAQSTKLQLKFLDNLQTNKSLHRGQIGDLVHQVDGMWQSDLQLTALNNPQNFHNIP